MADEDALRQQIAELAARIATLEATVEGLRAERGVQPANSSAASHTSISPPAVAVTAPAAVTSPPRSLENRIGAQFLNRIGILAVMIGVAWFLKLAFDRDWIGPLLRILIGLFSAAGLAAWSERFRRRGYAAFAYSLKALATGVAYLSLWAASSVFHLAPRWLVFLAMTAVTAANAALAWSQASELLAMYALAGGLATPALLSAGMGNELFLFSYLTLLNVGALLLLAVHRWTRIAWAALLGTGFYYIGWSLSSYSPAHLLLTVCFLTLFFGLFSAAPFLLLRPPHVSVHPAFFIAFPISNAAATWVALLILYSGRQAEGSRFWATLLLGIACCGIATVGRGRARLSQTCLGVGVFLVTAAIPFQFHGYQVALFWLGETLVLLVLARAWAHDALRVCGAFLLMLALAALVKDWVLGTPHPLTVIANMYFATALLGAAVFAAVTVISMRAPDGPARSLAGWGWLGALGSVAFSFTLLVAVSLEIHHYWFCGAGFFRDFCTGYGQLQRRTISAGFGLSAWWMAYGAGLMAVGFLRRASSLRWQALVILGLSIGKVFLNGVSLESQGYRVLSFLGLGVLLLAVSFAYQKDWLRLRS